MGKKHGNSHQHPDLTDDGVLMGMYRDGIRFQTKYDDKWLDKKGRDTVVDDIMTQVYSYLDSKPYKQNHVSYSWMCSTACDNRDSVSTKQKYNDYDAYLRFKAWSVCAHMAKDGRDYLFPRHR